MGTLVSALGCYVSVVLDTPTGATIVVTFGGILVLMFFVHLIVHHGRSARELEGAASAHRELETAASSSREASFLVCVGARLSASFFVLFLFRLCRRRPSPVQPQINPLR